MFSRICGAGHALPSRLISNTELSEQVDTTDAWIFERTGIRQRYRVGENETTSSLATQAAQNALVQANCTAQDIDLIIVATTTPDHAFPSTACYVQAQLGNTQAAAFDIQAVCSGFVYALTIADQMIKGGQARRALVIGAETMSRLIDWNDRATCVLFGDGAGAVVLEASAHPGILAGKLYADGAHAPALQACGWRSDQASTIDPFLRMDGGSVFRFAVNAMSQALRNVLDMVALTPADLDWVIPHQANQRILDAVAERAGVSPERVISTVGEHANTSAASIPLALSCAVADGRIQRGQRIGLVSMGAGFTWGSMVLIW